MLPRCPVHDVLLDPEFGCEYCNADAPPCDECDAGDHGECDGSSWDLINNYPCACPCDVNNHEESDLP